MSGNNNEFNDQESQEIKKALIEQLPNECRSLGLKFFECIEEETSKQLPSSGENTSYEEVEKLINNSIIPICISQYNIEDCVNKNTKQI